MEVWGLTVPSYLKERKVVRNRCQVLPVLTDNHIGIQVWEERDSLIILYCVIGLNLHVICSMDITVITQQVITFQDIKPIFVIINIHNDFF